MKLAQIIPKLHLVLDRLCLKYMLVGGMATDYYGFPRATFDVDISFILEPEDVARFVEVVKENGFDVNLKEVETMVKIGNRFIIEDNESLFRVDFWLAKNEYELVSLNRRRRCKILGKQVWIISPEDLILNKLLAGRSKDIEDALGILKRQEGNLEKNYLLIWAERLQVSEQLQEIRGEIKK
ncbi:MAG: nucleotidyltransferase [bacterium]|nr:nucleotidyltransferase [bacterium]